MNADSYVNLAANWINVGPQINDEIEHPDRYVKLTPTSNNDPSTTNFTFEYKEDNLKYLEHVEVILDLDCVNRGVLEFYLTSPQQTRVQLLGQRQRDRSSLGFKNWSLMSVATWSEDPKGLWTLEIVDVREYKNQFISVLLTLSTFFPDLSHIIHLFWNCQQSHPASLGH